MCVMMFEFLLGNIRHRRKELTHQCFHESRVHQQLQIQQLSAHLQVDKAAVVGQSDLDTATG